MIVMVWNSLFMSVFDVKSKFASGVDEISVIVIFGLYASFAE